MKKINQILPRFIAVILHLFLLTGVVFSQAPGKFNYQAVLRDAQGVAKSNYVAAIQVSVLQGSTSGSAIYNETHNVTTSALGMINLEIGSVNPTDFSNIDWSNGPYFLRIKIDGIEMGTTQLLSVPFALYAQTAETANNVDVTGDETAFSNWDKNASDDFSGDYDDLSGKPNIPAAVTGTESVFNAWDKNAANDFSGNYNDLTNKPTTVPDNSVNAQKIVDGSISTADLASNSITSSLIADGTITNSDIADEPGVDWIESTTAVLIPTSCGPISSVTITAPRSGYVIVTASGFVNWLVNSSGTGTIDLKVGRYSGNMDPPYQCIGISGISRAEYYRFPFSVTRVFEVTAGSITFYLNALHANVVGQAWVHHHQLVALFVPTRY